MPEGENEGGDHKEGGEEAPAWNNLWGAKEKYADPLQAALHDIPEELNGLNQANGWTQGARLGNQLEHSAEMAEHLAANAETMGNTAMAERFGARASAYSAFGEESRGGLNALVENPMMKVGGNLAGAALGGLSIYNGIGEWNKGDKTQGGMDIGAGGLGVTAGLAGAGEGIAAGLGATGAAGALGAVGAVAAPAAIVAGLAALGNGEGKKLGVWDFMGKNADGSHMDSLQMVGNATKNAYTGTDNAIEGALGDHWYSKALGKGIGGLAGGATALGTGAMGLVADVGLGAYDVGKGVVNAGAWAGNKIGQGASWLGGEIGSGAKAIGSGIGSAASAVGSGIGSAASTIGHGIGSAASAVGSGIGSAASAVGGAASSAWHSVTSW